MTYRIGEFARRVGMTVEGVRFYERAGLLRPRGRTASGQRLFGDAEVDRVRFMRACQRMGFTLGEIAELLRLREGSGDCADVRARLRGKLDQVHERSRLLAAFSRQLDEAIARCDRQIREAGEGCPTLEHLGAGLGD